jgi:hypothetical protein
MCGIPTMLMVKDTGKAQGLQHLAVNGSRPLSLVANQLEARFGLLVAYEDSPLKYEGDFVDRASPELKAKGQKALYPRGGQLEVDYAVASSGQEPENPTDLILRLLKDHVNRGNPGIFCLRLLNGLYDIIPTDALDQTGRMQKVRAILDLPITLPVKDRTLYETMDSVCKEVSTAGQVSVLLGTVPTNYFMQRHVALGCTSRAARQVLMDILFLTRRSLVWRLNCDASGKYMLNFKIPMMEVTNVRGGKQSREIPFTLIESK